MQETGNPTEKRGKRNFWDNSEEGFQEGCSLPTTQGEWATALDGKFVAKDSGSVLFSVASLPSTQREEIGIVKVTETTDENHSGI